MNKGKELIQKWQQMLGELPEKEFTLQDMLEIISFSAGLTALMVSHLPATQQQKTELLNNLLDDALAKVNHKHHNIGIM